MGEDRETAWRRVVADLYHSLEKCWRETVATQNALIESHTVDGDLTTLEPNAREEIERLNAIIHRAIATMKAAEEMRDTRPEQANG